MIYICADSYTSAWSYARQVLRLDSHEYSYVSRREQLIGCYTTKNPVLIVLDNSNSFSSDAIAYCEHRNVPIVYP
jgi:hypothetical protein